MASHLAVLTLLLVLVYGTAFAGVSQKQPVRCLKCHPAHYAEAGSCHDCHRGNSRTSRRELAHAGFIAARYAGFPMPGSASAKRGRKLADDSACRRCHLLEGRGNRLSVNLDLLLKGSNPQEIAVAIKKPAIYMPDFHFSNRDRDDLITAILAAGYRHGRQAAEPHQVVHFETGDSKQPDQFSKHCGGCHRLLSLKLGGVGTGISGPNLSGLLSAHYPASYPENLTWSRERLKKWLQNPRKLRSSTLMRPVPLKEQEWQQLLEILEVAGDYSVDAAADPNRFNNMD